MGQDKKNNNIGKAMVMAAVLQTLPRGDRRSLCNTAMNMTTQDVIPVIFPFEAFPNDMNGREAAALLAGMGANLFALASADQTTPKQTILASAESMASAKPYLGDPMSNDSLPIASAMMTIAAVDPEAKKNLEDGGVYDTVRELALLYGCCAHEGPFGSVKLQTPLVGKLKKGWLKRGLSNLSKKVTVNGIQIGASAANLGAMVSPLPGMIPAANPTARTTPADQVASNAIDALAGTAAGQASLRKLTDMGVPNTMAKAVIAISTSRGSDPATDVIATARDLEISPALAARYLVYVSAGMSEMDAKDMITNGLEHASALDQYLANIKDDLADYKSRIASAAEKLKNTTDSAEAATRDYAKLTWADAILNGGDDVAELLKQVPPNGKNAREFMTSMMSLIPAAKSSGNISTVAALMSALKTASGGKQDTYSTLSNLLAGDPNSVADEMLTQMSMRIAGVAENPAQLKLDVAKPGSDDEDNSFSLRQSADQSSSVATNTDEDEQQIED